MADAQDDGALCVSCKALTLIMLRDGYKHPLSYGNTVLSGQTCRLCRLIVCSLSTLQTKLNSRGLEERYMSLVESLPTLPAVSRRQALGIGLLEISEPLRDLEWSRHEYLPNNREIQKGNFTQGETIQVTSPSSKYNIHVSMTRLCQCPH